MPPYSTTDTAAASSSTAFRSATYSSPPDDEGQPEGGARRSLATSSARTNPRRGALHQINYAESPSHSPHFGPGPDTSTPEEGGGGGAPKYIEERSIHLTPFEGYRLRIDKIEDDGLVDPVDLFGDSRRRDTITDDFDAYLKLQGPSANAPAVDAKFSRATSRDATVIHGVVEDFHNAVFHHMASKRHDEVKSVRLECTLPSFIKWIKRFSNTLFGNIGLDFITHHKHGKTERIAVRKVPGSDEY
eukprot:CAMPEP_0173397474 /NCGR_PEP_ID=MMETSP1356-20130122/38505_1 /TAXON_ID=77927 ORGANISM="Hemiselmis virescens, Strain PCC157" /NCGR_SAMPLE_ID=MMETSP1356 /ASSEMBLY_ACC=CAM_ASM_000847 /LENGTH=244 /DNA_ID=CAMNT_0014356745 /DNA_START=146 /DNA_END=877 /DNA_ORIENTATION=+